MKNGSLAIMIGSPKGHDDGEEKDDAHSQARDEAGRAVASALGVDPENVDGEALCQAIRDIMDLEYEEEEPASDEE